MKKRIVGILLSIILVVCSIYLFFHLVRLNVLPSKLLFLIITVILLLDVILILVCNFYRKHLITKIIVGAVIFVLSGCSVFAGYYLEQTNTMFSNITSDSSTSKNVVSIVVKESSDINDLEGINRQRVGRLRSTGLAGTEAMLQSIEKQGVSIEQVNYDGILNLVDAFYADEVTAIILNESSRSTITENENYVNFDKNTKVIYQTSYETQSSNASNSVNDITAHAFNVLITGSDSRIGLEENSRSDVVMIVTVNPTTNTILLTSIPRDYYVTTVCDAQDACQNGAMDKITHTGLHGVNTTKRTVENLLGIEINYTFKVGFESVTQVVDAVGGVDVYVEPGYAVDKLGIVEGTNHLDGEQALKYARERYSYTEGDRQRTKNQQQVLMGVIDKLISPSILANYAQLMEALSNTFETNMTTETIQELIKYQLNENPDWKFEQYMVDGTGNSLICAELGQAAYVMVPDQTTVELAKQKIAAVMDGKSSEDITSSFEN